MERDECVNKAERREEGKKEIKKKGKYYQM